MANAAFSWPAECGEEALGRLAESLDAKAAGFGARSVGLALGDRIDATRAVLRLAIDEAFKGRIAVVSSFGAESAALLGLVADIAPQAPVIFIDTGKHFAQTLSYRKSLAAELGLSNVRDVGPPAEDLAGVDPEGDLWRRDADSCCDVRKVRPLRAALEGFDAWVTGRKRFQGGLRAALPVFEMSRGRIKVNPLAAWSAEDVDAYGEIRGLPAHPLVGDGFPSIGCWPCTRPAARGEDQRSGRWRGSAKTECGIHQI